MISWKLPVCPAAAFMRQIGINEKWTSRDERYLTIRCFKFQADSEPKYDLRYEIDMPLGMYKARAGFQHGQLWFLIDVDESVIANLAAAKKDINVVPREGGAKLDEIIAFSSAGLAEPEG